MTKKNIEVFYVALFCAVLLIIMIQTLFKPFKEHKLYGVTVETKAPILSSGSWFSGKFQKTFATFFSERIGFRAFWVKTENQISFSLNHRISAKSDYTGTKIVLGKDNWLYQESYINSYVHPCLKNGKHIEKKVKKIRQLQDRLHEHHIGFLVVISPSKAETYPEFIPDKYLANLSERPKNSRYFLTIKYFKKYGINYIDTQKLLLKWKKEKPYPLFAKGGAHWNYYSAFFALQKITEALNTQIKKTIPVPVCLSVHLKDPRGTDRDLGRLINIWTEKATEAPTPYPELLTVHKPSNHLPDILVVGCSFVWTLMHYASQEHLYNHVDFLYYYRTLYTYPGKKKHVFHPGPSDLSTLLQGKDAMIIEMNITIIPYNWGTCVDDTLRCLDTSSELILSSATQHKK